MRVLSTPVPATGVQFGVYGTCSGTPSVDYSSTPVHLAFTCSSIGTFSMAQYSATTVDVDEVQSSNGISFIHYHYHVIIEYGNVILNFILKF